MGKYSLAILVTVVLSLLTYFFVETPFRNKAVIGKWKLYLILFLISTFLISSSYFVYNKAGVVRNYPELGLVISEQHYSGENAQFNDRVNKMDLDFKLEDHSKPKILVIGTSFGRDFVNMLLENQFNDSFQISYISMQNFDHNKYEKRLKQSDIIIFSSLSSPSQLVYNELKKKYQDLKEKYIKYGKKFFFVGTKSFGNNANAFFNTSDAINRCNLRTKINEEFHEFNNQGKRDFGNEFIDILGLITDDSNTVPVFTNDCKLISQDCEHLTKYGAEFIGKKLISTYQLNKLFEK
jgi:hypothetical protein